MACRYAVCLGALGDFVSAALVGRSVPERIALSAFASIWLRDCAREHRALVQARRQYEEGRWLPEPPTWRWVQVMVSGLLVVALAVIHALITG